jgi:hypothetical protein
METPEYEAASRSVAWALIFHIPWAIILDRKAYQHFVDRPESEPPRKCNTTVFIEKEEFCGRSPARHRGDQCNLRSECIRICDA